MSENQNTRYPSIDKPWLKYYSSEAINTPLPEQTLYEHIWERNKNNLNTIALYYFGRCYTYQKMFREIDAAANAFYAIGVRENDIVTICMPTTPETVFSIYALNKIGAVVNMIDLATNDSFFVERLSSTHSKCLVLLDTLEGKAVALLEQSMQEKIILVSPTNALPLVQVVRDLKEKRLMKKSEKKNDRIIRWNSFIKLGKHVVAPQFPYEQNHPALIVYTGGTTGVPKGAVLSNDGINATITQLKHTGIQSKTGDKYLDIMPPFIAYGVVCGIHNPLSERQEIIIIPKLDPHKFPIYIKKFKPNHIIGVPALFETMIRSDILQKENLGFIHNLICGGDKLTPVSEDRINTFLSEHHSCAKVAQGFGMTEVGTSVTYTVPTSYSPKPNHIGIPLSHTTIKICEPDTEEELEYLKPGEICINTPSIMLGYYNNPQETEKTIKTHSDGRVWVHSKDIGYMDEQGELYFVDRLKRMIIRHDGHNVWPGAIEQIIETHHAVDACAVVGIKTKENTNGEIPTAFIVLKKDFKTTQAQVIEEIDKLCKQHLPGRDVAQVYKVIPALPKTSIGKIDYRTLEKESIES